MMDEPWRELYLKIGHQYVEPLEYIPCPGSIKFCALKPQPEEPEEICQCIDDEDDLYRLDE